MAKKIVVSLRKGGGAKTTTAVNLATALHLKGKKVLLVDLDPQSNATLSVGIDPTNLDKHINLLFTRADTRPEDMIITTSFGLPLLASHPDLADTESGMNTTSIGTLKALITPLETQYDYIIFDTPPSESYLTVSALVVADMVLIPLQAHFLAMRGLKEAIREIEEVKNGLNPGLVIAGILPTMVNARTNISKTVLEAVTATYKGLVYPFQIEFSVKHAEASLAGLPIVIYDPGHQGSQAYNQLADIFISHAKK